MGSGLSSQGSPSEFEKAHMGPDPGMVEVDTWVKTWGISPGSSVHGTLMAQFLEWVAILYSRGSSRPRD